MDKLSTTVQSRCRTPWLRVACRRGCTRQCHPLGGSRRHGVCVQSVQVRLRCDLRTTLCRCRRRSLGSRGSQDPPGRRGVRTEGCASWWGCSSWEPVLPSRGCLGFSQPSKTTSMVTWGTFSSVPDTFWLCQPPSLY